MELGPVLGVGAVAAGCRGRRRAGPPPAVDAGGDLAAIKDYLTEHSAELAEQTEVLKQRAERTTSSPKPPGFDYEALLRRTARRCRRSSPRVRTPTARRTPAYEEMEGIVAGVPRLAQYDVDIDAGSDASDPENAVSFSLELPDGEVLEAAGQLLVPDRDLVVRDQPGLPRQGRRGRRRRRRRGRVRRGLPDANFLVAPRCAQFDEMADQLDADAQEFEPTASDAFTAITVMTPTMSEYFEAWKNSRFIAGGGRPTSFVAASRLPDIADILEGHRLHLRRGRAADRGGVAAAGRADRKALTDLLAYVEDLRDREEGGEQFTAEQADTLGSEAQRQAEAIAGQVAQAAQRLGSSSRRRSLGIRSPARRDHPASGRGGGGRRDARRGDRRVRTRPAGRRPPPWKAAEQVRSTLFEAQTALLLDEAAAASSAGRSAPQN